MRPKVAIIYNDPAPSRYQDLGEEKAVLGVLDEVEGVYQSLVELGYPVERIPLSPPLEAVSQTLASLKTDLVFNLFEGFDGCPETEAVVAGMLEGLNIPHTGCPASALSVAVDKGRTKALLQTARIATPRYQLLDAETVHLFHLAFPCIVKPCVEDASHGITEESFVQDFAALSRQVAKISAAYRGRALVEEFMEGREFNITVMGTDKLTALPISEIAYSLPPGMPRILTFSAKWELATVYADGTKVTCPAQIDLELKTRIEKLAMSVYRLLGCSGYARVDLRLNGKGKPHVLEVNPNPDISPDVGAARQARASGMTYSEFIERITSLALEGTKLPLGA
ncbi:MAG: ATP-grasp domain-containing protein [Dehalococcoidia bacterium]|nr:ATP-grasp domain-containing protein [Dehalococcoidia bacterium]